MFKQGISQEKNKYLHEWKVMKGDNKSEDSVAEKITQDINEHFSGGYNIIWNDTLNLFLVNFDLIRILKNHIGYNSWSDVPMEQR